MVLSRIFAALRARAQRKWQNFYLAELLIDDKVGIWLLGVIGTVAIGTYFKQLVRPRLRHSGSGAGVVGGLSWALGGGRARLWWGFGRLTRWRLGGGASNSAITSCRELVSCTSKTPLREGITG